VIDADPIANRNTVHTRADLSDDAGLKIGDLAAFDLAVAQIYDTLHAVLACCRATLAASRAQ
jgi:hypothetical protein